MYVAADKLWIMFWSSFAAEILGPASYCCNEQFLLKIDDTYPSQWLTELSLTQD